MKARAREVAIAAAVAATALGIYLATLQPDFGGPEDTPKFQFIGYVLGTPHPPGYPLYVLLSHAFVALPIGTIAYRANLFSAVMAALACALSYAIARQLEARRWPAVCAALGVATGASFWRSAVFAEVYSLAAVMAALTIVLLLAWGSRGGTRRLLAAFGAFAVGLGNHLTIVGLVPAFAIYVLTRGRRVWSVQLLGGGALLLAIGLGQYAVILVRTHQGAPYLESRAETFTDLIGVVTAERYADQRFAFSPAVLFTEHLPVLMSLVLSELGVAGAALCLVGAAAGVRRADPALVLGAAAGMFAMILNVSGDLTGFITPLMALLWPLAAVGIDRAAHFAGSIHRAGPTAAALVLGAAVMLNGAANHASADQSDQSEQARFWRGVFSQLPRESGIIAENYLADMAWTYYTVTGEAGLDRRIARVGFDAASVRRAAQDGRRVFAFGGAATFLSAEGLQFRRTAIEGPPLGRWLASLPRGSVLVGATARASFPATLAAIGHADLHPQVPARAFEVFAAVAGRPGAVWRAADEDRSLSVDAASVGAGLPPFAGALTATSGTAGAGIDLAGRTIAHAERGVVLAVFAPDGTFVRALEWPPGAPMDVPYAGAVYELAGTAPCATLTADRWTDISAVLASGGWVSTFASRGSITIDMIVPAAIESGRFRVRSTLLMGDGTNETTVSAAADGDTVTTTLTRAGESRPVFRLALDRVPPAARARLRSGGARPALDVCAFHAANPLFAPGQQTGVLRADFESEAYFGAGWTDTQRTAAGPVRRGAEAAALFLPLESGVAYRLALDLAVMDTDRAFEVDVMLNGLPIGSCRRDTAGICSVLLPPAAIVAGTNVVRLSSPPGSARLTFREARIQIAGS